MEFLVVESICPIEFRTRLKMAIEGLSSEEDYSIKYSTTSVGSYISYSALISYRHN